MKNLYLVASLALLPIACAGPVQRTFPDAAVGIIELLADDQPVFGIFSGAKTGEQGALMGMNRDLDFVFYSLERGPFDLATMSAYQKGMLDAVGPGEAHPLALRIPAIRDGEAEARERVRLALEAGADAIVFPHIENAEQAAVAVTAVDSGLRMLILEDRIAVENARSIAATDGVDVVFAGPGDLRRAYAGDMEAVEAAIQRVLAACKEAGVPAGITAGVDDIAERIAQGFQVFIVSNPAAVTIGRSQ